MKNPVLRLVLSSIVVSLSFAVLTSCAPQHPDSRTKLLVVAAENFWGDLATQVGGDQVHVVSLMNNPNLDPHEYEANIADAKDVAEAHLVIKNGGGYDTWMNKLLAASPSSKRVVLTAWDLAPEKLPENEHIWYGVTNDIALTRALAAALTQLDPTHAAYFSANAAKLLTQWQNLRQQMAQLKLKLNHTPIGLTETIFLYQTGDLGLNVLTPFAFMKAVAEGTDPSLQDTYKVEQQIRSHAIKVLVINEQTLSPLVDKLQKLAASAGIPVVPITETMSQGPMPEWLGGQLNRLATALGHQAVPEHPVTP